MLNAFAQNKDSAEQQSFPGSMNVVSLVHTAEHDLWKKKTSFPLTKFLLLGVNDNSSNYNPKVANY